MKNVNENKLDAASFHALTRKSPWPWLRDAFLDWGVICFTLYVAYAWNSPFGYLLAVFIVGNRQHALAILGHDGTHFSVTKNKKVNDFLTNLVTFWPIGLTASGYRNLHFTHHKHTNTPNDPELMHRSAKAPQWDLPITLKRVLRYAAMDMVGYSLTDYVMIVAFAKPDKKSSYLWMVCFHASVVAASVSLGLWWAAAVWYFSLPTAFMMFFRLRTWLEHQGSDDTHKLHLNIWQRHLLSPHFAWYHHEHHHWPSVPYYNLPALRARLCHEKVLTLSELIKHHEDAPFIRSGQALKTVKRDEEVTKAERSLAA